MKTRSSKKCNEPSFMSHIIWCAYFACRYENFAKGKSINKERKLLARLNENMKFKGCPDDRRYKKRAMQISYDTRVEAQNKKSMIEIFKDELRKTDNKKLHEHKKSINNMNTQDQRTNQLTGEIDVYHQGPSSEYKKRLLSEDKLVMKQRDQSVQQENQQPESPMKKQSSIAIHAENMICKTTFKRQETLKSGGQGSPMMKSQMSPLMRGGTIRDVQKDKFSEVGAGDCFDAQKGSPLYVLRMSPGNSSLPLQREKSSVREQNEKMILPGTNMTVTDLRKLTSEGSSGLQRMTSYRFTIKENNLQEARGSSETSSLLTSSLSDLTRSSAQSQVKVRQKNLLGDSQIDQLSQKSSNEGQQSKKKAKKRKGVKNKLGSRVAHKMAKYGKNMIATTMQIVMENLEINQSMRTRKKKKVTGEDQDSDQESSDISKSDKTSSDNCSSEKGSIRLGSRSKRFRNSSRANQRRQGLAVVSRKSSSSNLVSSSPQSKSKQRRNTIQQGINPMRDRSDFLRLIDIASEVKKINDKNHSRRKSTILTVNKRKFNQHDQDDQAIWQKSEEVNTSGPVRQFTLALQKQKTNYTQTTKRKFMKQVSLRQKSLGQNFTTESGMMSTLYRQASYQKRKSTPMESVIGLKRKITSLQKSKNSTTPRMSYQTSLQKQFTLRPSSSSHEVKDDVIEEKDEVHELGEGPDNPMAAQEKLSSVTSVSSALKETSSLIESTHEQRIPSGQTNAIMEVSEKSETNISRQGVTPLGGLTPHAGLTPIGALSPKSICSASKGINKEQSFSKAIEKFRNLDPIKSIQKDESSANLNMLFVNSLKSNLDSSLLDKAQPKTTSEIHSSISETPEASKSSKKEKLSLRIPSLGREKKKSKTSNEIANFVNIVKESQNANEKSSSSSSVSLRSSEHKQLKLATQEIVQKIDDKELLSPQNMRTVEPLDNNLLKQSIEPISSIPQTSTNSRQKVKRVCSMKIRKSIRARKSQDFQATSVATNNIDHIMNLIKMTTPQRKQPETGIQRKSIHGMTHSSIHLHQPKKYKRAKSISSASSLAVSDKSKEDSSMKSDLSCPESARQREAPNIIIQSSNNDEQTSRRNEQDAKRRSEALQIEILSAPSQSINIKEQSAKSAQKDSMQFAGSFKTKCNKEEPKFSANRNLGPNTRRKLNPSAMLKEISIKQPCLVRLTSPKPQSDPKVSHQSTKAQAQRKLAVSLNQTIANTELSSAIWKLPVSNCIGQTEDRDSCSSMLENNCIDKIVFNYGGTAKRAISSLMQSQNNTIQASTSGKSVSRVGSSLDFAALRKRLLSTVKGQQKEPFQSAADASTIVPSQRVNSALDSKQVAIRLPYSYPTTSQKSKPPSISDNQSFSITTEEVQTGEGESNKQIKAHVMRYLTKHLNKVKRSRKTYSSQRASRQTTPVEYLSPRDIFKKRATKVPTPLNHTRAIFNQSQTMKEGQTIDYSVRSMLNRSVIMKQK